MATEEATSVVVLTDARVFAGRRFGEGFYGSEVYGGIGNFSDPSWRRTHAIPIKGNQLGPGQTPIGDRQYGEDNYGQHFYGGER